MLCPNCHSPAEDGDVCSICEVPLRKADASKPVAAVPVQQRTIDERHLMPGLPASAPPARYPAQPGASSPSVRRVTVFAPHAAERAVARGAADSGTLGETSSPPRKIVGALVTYTWRDEGQLFPVLEGRNRIGSDPQQCEIAIPQDDTLSAVNSHIIFRKHFTIGDNVSMCGTDVNGEPIESPTVPLHNYARIRTGSTQWTFIAIQPQEHKIGNAPADDTSER